MANLYFQFRGIGPKKALFARTYAPSKSEAVRIVMERMYMRASIGRAICPVEIEEKIGTVSFPEDGLHRVYFDENEQPQSVGSSFSVTLYQRRVLLKALAWEAKYGSMPFRASDLGEHRPEKALYYLTDKGVLMPVLDADGKQVRFHFVI